jgi:3-hydroxybutyryl-CoA dehydrogenase
VKEKILVLGMGGNAHLFCEMCKETGIEAILLGSVDNIDSYLKDNDIIVQFLDDSLNVSVVAVAGSVKGSQIWLCESIDQSVTAMAKQAGSPERYVGFSLSGLFPEKKLVELIGGERTADDAMAVARDLFEKLQFTVVIAQDRSGRVLNRVVASMINEAVYVSMYNLAKMEDIDQMMRLGANFPMGPFEYADAVGLDRVLKTWEWLTEEIGPQYLPCPLLRRKVEAGFLGRKTGRGFYTY